MVPVELDHTVLNKAPAPEYKSINRVIQTLKTILSQKIIPYFKNERGVSLLQLADLRQAVVFRRMEDEENRIFLPSLLLRQKQGWAILIHQRLFDHLAHVFSVRSEFETIGRSPGRRRVAQILRVSFETPFRASCFSQCG